MRRYYIHDVDQESLLYLLGYLTEDQWTSAFVNALEAKEDGSGIYGPEWHEIKRMALITEGRWSGCMDIEKVMKKAHHDFIMDKKAIDEVKKD